MSDQTEELRNGDRVRVTVEGSITQVYGERIVSLDNGSSRSLEKVFQDKATTIEKIKTPVVKFTAGQTVRSKNDRKKRHLGLSGYELELPHGVGEWFTYGEGLGQPKSWFTSVNHDLVPVE